ncbi:MAG: protein-export chaperone SecB [Sedimenticola sp.]|uniref:Protein-export protein SecB n=1 Tax=Sedimenticola thiotaurini TaxID=1543721 RepID=A0A558DFG6_9GAMM|nr:protein-export chaperone SecB [Sedimenticola sp.]TVT59776.1 MAG: protein-export chaperone SecB [Sedimenticola thiotaurini]MCW8882618.1 protein-export chaperone SecB [Sedimenticola sp.]MCW8947591.1 protein-export chaperone SecB [Sedimenticola sp.]MCW8976211.1 protein-export chaperone SecB [Sedimenticola sp.]
MTENAQPTEHSREFSLQRIFVKDISFETPNSPSIFTLEWKPESSLNLNSNVSKLDNDLYEIVLTVTVTTKIGDKTAYLVEVQQGGIFTIRNFPEEEMGHMIGAYCPNILFPYAREVVSDLVSKGSFPQLLLTPVSFDALYAQHMQEQAQQAQAAEPATH